MRRFLWPCAAVQTAPATATTALQGSTAVAHAATNPSRARNGTIALGLLVSTPRSTSATIRGYMIHGSIAIQVPPPSLLGSRTCHAGPIRLRRHADPLLLHCCCTLSWSPPRRRAHHRLGMQVAFQPCEVSSHSTTKRQSGMWGHLSPSWWRWLQLHRSCLSHIVQSFRAT